MAVNKIQTREDVERWTKLYLIQHNNIPSPTHKEIEDYILGSVDFFGSMEEYIKILHWFFKLDYK